MARDRRRTKGRRTSGTFVSIPHECLHHPNYARLSASAVKLLFDLYAQYRGANNGDFSATWAYMNQRGWKSKDTLARALRELSDTGWIVLTRQGGRNQCSLYAVTFKAIDECGGKLDVHISATAPGTWKQTVETSKTVPRSSGQRAPTIGSMTVNP